MKIYDTLLGQIKKTSLSQKIARISFKSRFYRITFFFPFAKKKKEKKKKKRKKENVRRVLRKEKVPAPTSPASS